MGKNKAAQELGKKSWKARKNKKETKAALSRAGKLGAKKTNAIKAAKRLALDNTTVPTPNTANA